MGCVLLNTLPCHHGTPPSAATHWLVRPGFKFTNDGCNPGGNALFLTDTGSALTWEQAGSGGNTKTGSLSVTLANSAMIVGPQE